MSASVRIVSVMTRKPFGDAVVSASRASFRAVTVTVHTVLICR
ncbi:hypothetical protein [Phycicoccus sonneratiae]|nr:hypothetical protein [Phycicoccus sonneraticus]